MRPQPRHQILHPLAPRQQQRFALPLLQRHKGRHHSQVRFRFLALAEIQGGLDRDACLAVLQAPRFVLLPCRLPPDLVQVLRIGGGPAPWPAAVQAAKAQPLPAELELLEQIGDLLGADPIEVVGHRALTRQQTQAALGGSGGVLVAGQPRLGFVQVDQAHGSASKVDLV